jgi:hypothetical protein
MSGEIFSQVTNHFLCGGFYLCAFSHGMSELGNKPVPAVTENHFHAKSCLHLVSTDKWYPSLARTEIFRLLFRFTT